MATSDGAADEVEAATSFALAAVSLPTTLQSETLRD